MRALIYQPAKTAMQSGRAGNRRWALEFDQEAARRIDPLMGWTSSSDMAPQLQLDFESKTHAIDFCERNGIDFRIADPKTRKVRPRAYSENFSYYSLRGPGTEPLDRP